MPIQLREGNDGKILVIHISGKLIKSDYTAFVPKFEEELRQHRALHVLFDMTGLHGWDAGAAWEDIKFDFKHFADIDRLAIVGDAKWQEGMSWFFKPFTKATVRFFDHKNYDAARTWLLEG